MLDVNNIHTYYGSSYILQGVSIHVPKESVVTILGRNGVGKTTLIHSVISFVKPSRGVILLDGCEITGHPTHEIMRRGIALVPQGRRVFRSLSVLENLTIPFRCPSLSETKIRPWREEEIFETFPILRERRSQMAGNLSGGEQQMLAIARALVSGTKVLLMDEPSEGLAPLIVENIANVIPRLRDRDMAILLVEQNFDMALHVSDKIYVMSRGKIVHESLPNDLRYNEEIKSRYLGV